MKQQYVEEVRELIRNWVDVWNAFAALEGDGRRLHFAVMKGKHYCEIKLAIRGAINSKRIDFIPPFTGVKLTGFSILINVEDITLTKVVLDEHKLDICFSNWSYLLKDKHLSMKNGINYRNYKIVYVMVHELEDIKQLLELQKGALETG